MTCSNKYIKFWIIWIFLLLFFSVSYFAFASLDQWALTLNILGIGIRHGTPNNLNFWTPIASYNDQELIWEFDSDFWVEDLEWYVTGHYTTIQCNGVYWSAGNRLTGVYLKAGNINPTLIMWVAGNVHIATELNDYVSIFTPITYIYKPTDIHNAWVANKYWDRPQLKIFIPGWTPPGSYSGTIVFSLYMY